jgi:hypothetical protein
LISVLRRPSDCSLFKSRLSSEGRIPGCALINESVFSKSPPGPPRFVDLTVFGARAALIRALGRFGLRFIAVALLRDHFKKQRMLSAISRACVSSAPWSITI